MSTHTGGRGLRRDPSGFIVIVVAIEACKLIFGAGTASRSTSLTHRCQANIDSIHRNWGTRCTACLHCWLPHDPLFFLSSYSSLVSLVHCVHCTTNCDPPKSTTSVTKSFCSRVVASMRHVLATARLHVQLNIYFPTVASFLR